jgi:predicted secreted protein
MPIAAMGTTIRKETGTAIAGLTSIGGLELSAETIDTTVLDSEGQYRTFTSSFKDAGEVSLSGYFEHTSHAAILADFEAGTTDAYTITFPNGATWTFDGVVVGFTTGFELEDLISFECSIKVSGSPTLTAPTAV